MIPYLEETYDVVIVGPAMQDVRPPGQCKTGYGNDYVYCQRGQHSR